MSDAPNPFDWMGVSGLIALLGSAVGFGSLKQKTDGHGARLDKLEDTSTAVTRLEVQMKGVSDDISEIKDTLKLLANRK